MEQRSVDDFPKKPHFESIKFFRKTLLNSFAKQQNNGKKGRKNEKSRPLIEGSYWAFQKKKTLTENRQKKKTI